jgi:hypothetical protein
MPDDRKTDRYGVRADPNGFTVFVVYTGEAAVMGGQRQTGLSEADARHTADLLNKQAKQGDSSMRRG